MDDRLDRSFATKEKSAVVPTIMSLGRFKATDVGIDGAIFRPDPNELPVFLKPLYNKSRTTPKFANKVIQVLEKLEGSNKFQRESHSSPYVTVGLTTNRGGTGIVPSKLHMLEKTELETIVRFVKQIEAVVSLSKNDHRLLRVYRHQGSSWYWSADCEFLG